MSLSQQKAFVQDHINLLKPLILLFRWNNISLGTSQSLKTLLHAGWHENKYSEFDDVSFCSSIPGMAAEAITSISRLLGMGNFLLFTGATQVPSCGAFESQMPVWNS